MEIQKGNVAVITLIIAVVAITTSVITWLIATRIQVPVAQPVVVQTQPVVKSAVTQPLPKGRIIDTTQYKVDDFLKQYSSLSQTNVSFIKKIFFYDANYPDTSSIIFVGDGVNANIIYFVDAGDNSSEKVNADIYSLDTQTNELKVLYKALPSVDSFNLIGRLDGKLLFEKINSNRSPGPCYNAWVYSYEHSLPTLKNNPDQYNPGTVKSLNINNLNIGFVDFVVPKDQYDSEKVIQETCYNEIHKTD